MNGKSTPFEKYFSDFSDLDEFLVIEDINYSVTYRLKFKNGYTAEFTTSPIYYGLSGPVWKITLFGHGNCIRADLSKLTNSSISKRYLTDDEVVDILEKIRRLPNEEVL